MAEYIEREEAIKATCENCAVRNICDGSCDDTDRLRAIPTADVVNVVRCKDCKKYGTPYCAVDLWTKEITIRKATENGFCNFGERREVQDG